MDYKFSVIVPVFNRPDEMNELLDSLTRQTYTNFEIIVVEDGSTNGCHDVVKQYEKKLQLKYFFKPNSGPGLSRNYGAERAHGDMFVFFDSDCIIPKDYFAVVNQSLNTNFVDAYGGPDMAHHSFTPIQKAISYSMTSFFTTGGIRGGKERLDKFHPRSFNMGFTPKVFETTHGFSEMRFGEDVDMSLRIIKSGLKTALIEKAAVYHKRRTDFRKFFKQVFNSGIARINLFKRHPESLKVVHLFPTLFLLGIIFCVVLSFWSLLFIAPLAFWVVLIFVDSTIRNGNPKIGFLSIISSFVQLSGYGAGFLKAFVKRILLSSGEFNAFTKNFYK